MYFKTSQNYVKSGILALVVNFFLFAALPNLVDRKFAESDVETVMPVSFTRIAPEKQKPIREEEKPPEKQTPPKPAPMTSMQHKSVMKRIVKMEQMAFEINMSLNQGMPVAMPPAPFAFKDFYNQGEVDQRPVPIFKIKPVYPYRARRLNIAGKVDVKFLVDKNGMVSRITILKSTPPGIFDDSVRKALAAWKFYPGKVKDSMVSTWVITTIEFNLDGV